jgi:hypothetical protein
VAAASGGPGVIVWRWFDAVVLDRSGPTVTMWEPLHGTFTARPRDPRRAYPVGSRAYASAGLPGADWWVAGSAVHRAEDGGHADVELAEVDTFLTEHGLRDA